MNTNYGPMKLEEYEPGKFRMVGGSTDARRTTDNGSRRDPANHKTTSRRGEPAPPLSEYDSKLEAARGNYLGYLMLAGDILKVVHHPFTIQLAPNKKYSPDFLVWWKDGRITVEEVKGSEKSKNARDSITRLHVAAGMFPMFEWMLVLRPKGQWEERRI